MTPQSHELIHAGNEIDSPVIATAFCLTDNGDEYNQSLTNYGYHVISTYVDRDCQQVDGTFSYSEEYMNVLVKLVSGEAEELHISGEALNYEFIRIRELGSLLLEAENSGVMVVILPTEIGKST